MKLYLRYLWVLPLALLAFTAHGQEKIAPLGVVELFTSQGCSACPEADAAMQKMIEAGDVIGLSYHIDYWDYLGWTDTLATPGNTKRQYDYAQALERSGVYTPQAIINGREHANGNESALIYERLRSLKSAGQGLTVPVISVINPSEISIDVGAGAVDVHAEIVVVYFKRQNTVTVQRGDNAGKRIAYWHNVTDVQVIGKWDGKPSRFTLPISQLPNDEDVGLAVLVQRLNESGKPKEIFGASVLYAKLAG